jgi:hypothetical protein
MKTFLLCIKIIFTILYLLIFNKESIGQNLIPNPSFEDFDTCPTQMGSMMYCNEWHEIKNSPDYFNACSASAVSVPSNPLGSQYAHTGNAYCGMVCYYVVPNARECIETELTTLLIPAQKYFISFHLNLSGGYSYTKACNKIGCKLSTVPFVFDSIQIDNTPFFYTNTIVDDTEHWVQIMGSFIADSSYKYIAFGNFFEDVNTDTLNLDTFSYISYYYIDDVCVSIDSMLCAGNPEQVEYLSSDYLNIFPNPSNSILNVSTTNKIEKINLYDIAGKEEKVHYEKADKLANDILTTYIIYFLNAPPSGIYLLKISCFDKTIVRKVIIQ